MLRLILVTVWLRSAQAEDEDYWTARYRSPYLSTPQSPQEEHMQDREPDTESYPKGEDTLGRRYVIRIQKDDNGHWMVWQQYLDQPPRHPEE